MPDSAPALAFDGVNHPLYPDDASVSAALHQRARRVMPSGNTRQTLFFKPYPLYAAQGDGCRVTDVDGVERIDFVGNYSSLIHGHRPPAVTAAAHAQLDRFTAVGMPTASEIDLAELLADRLGGVEHLRFANSGTEAVMLAIKAARAFTGRPMIAKVEGAYHGGYDFAEVSQTAGPPDWGDPDRPVSLVTAYGTPSGVMDSVLVLPWNDLAAARALIEAHAGDLAGVLIDPMPSRIAYAPIAADFLAMLRETTARVGALLILDEVYNLRLGYHGAQGRFGAEPDLTALGKIIGGGFPVGAVGGRAEVMSVFAFDDGPPRVPHGGAYNGNPVSMVAGHKTMELMTPAAFDRLEALGDRLREGLRAALRDAGVAGSVSGLASFAAIVLGDLPVRTYRDLVAARVHAGRLAALHHALLNRGVIASPQLGFTLSTPMGEDEIDMAVAETRAALAGL